MAKIRDENTKINFIAFLMENPELRFMQALSIFVWQYLDKNAQYILTAGRKIPTHIKQYDKVEDTFFWECDELMKKRKEEEDGQESK